MGQLVQPMSAVEAVLLLLDLQELELAQLQPGPEVPVLEACGGSTLTILPESKLDLCPFWLCHSFSSPVYLCSTFGENSTVPRLHLGQFFARPEFLNSTNKLLF